jgi:hypothetical protein
MADSARADPIAGLFSEGGAEKSFGAGGSDEEQPARRTIRNNP